MNRTPEEISKAANQILKHLNSPEGLRDNDDFLIISLIDEYMRRIEKAITPYSSLAIPYIVYALKSVSDALIKNQSIELSFTNLQVFKMLTNTIQTDAIVKRSNSSEKTEV